MFVVRSENTSTNEQDAKTERFLNRLDSKYRAGERRAGQPAPENSESINGRVESEEIR